MRYLHTLDPDEFRDMGEFDRMRMRMDRERESHQVKENERNNTKSKSLYNVSL